MSRIHTSRKFLELLVGTDEEPCTYVVLVYGAFADGLNFVLIITNDRLFSVITRNSDVTQEKYLQQTL